jgi:non-specific serine/threonine protein kinase/serine/threonine-protein kinase
MGAVYKAVRADDVYSKIVAIKIVPLSDPHLMDRFRQERQILAALEHPNIARLLDGGSTADGRPFLAMEFVDGPPIDRFVKDRRLGVRETVSLFRKVCGAVSYAHRNLVVHRDLKPSNILVDADGEPKLLDFGIAKLVDPARTATKSGLDAMTPTYASPEQILGASLTTATDVYSLGVLLFELLSGSRPYRPTSNQVDLARAITEDPPLALGPKFDRDLDNIVQMALRKEPERRYPSVEQLSEDLRRYLEGYPVLARPASAGYRSWMFAKRNRVAVIGGLLTFVAMVIGIAATSWQAHIANERFNDLRVLAHNVVFDYHDAIEALPGATKVRERLVKDALVYLNKLAQTGGDESLRRELADSYVRIGNVQGSGYQSNLGDVKGALKSIDRGVAIAERLVQSNASLPNRTSLADAYKSRAQIRDTAGQLNDAADDYRKSIAEYEQLLPKLPAEDVDTRVAAINTYRSYGELLAGEGTTNLGRPAAEGMVPYRSALALAQELVRAHAGDRRAAKALFSVQLAIAVLTRAAGDYAEAEKMNRAALEAITPIAKANPNNSNDQVELAVAQERLVSLLVDDNKAAEAVPIAQHVTETVTEMLRGDPSNAMLIRDQQISWSQAGIALLRSGAAAEARTALEKSLQLAIESAGKDAEAAPNLAGCHANLALALTNSGKAEQAIEHARASLEILHNVPASARSNDSWRQQEVIGYLRLGEALFKGNQFAPALAEFVTGERLASGIVAENPKRVSAQTRLADMLAGKARCEARLGAKVDAARDFKSSLGIWRTLQQSKKLMPRLANEPKEIEGELERVSLGCASCLTRVDAIQ